MGGRLLFSDFFRNISLNRFIGEPFLVFDIGTFSVKSLHVEAKSGAAKVVSFSNTQYASGDINADGSFNVPGITNACRSCLEELKSHVSYGRRFTNKVVLGIGGGFVHGKTLTQSYIRDYPNEELSEGEFSNIVQKVQQRNYEQIRRDFKRETGRSELEVYLINGALEDIKIDGYQVVNPIGFRGKEVSCGLFNSYIAKGHLAAFEGIIKSLKLELVSVISQPHAAFSSLILNEIAETDFILIDIGGSSTEISLARKGRLDDIRSISLGGSSFTKSISENLKVGFLEAENIKRIFAEGGVAKYAAKRIEAIIMADVELFLRGLEMILSDLSQVSLLPSKIYIYGGGSRIPIVSKAVKQQQWRAPLSFFAKPVLVNFTPGRIGCLDNALKDEVLWAAPFALARMYLRELKRDDQISKNIRRSLRLIQG
ncbi:MAG: cell division FtsA domain-containing protein [Candidatus Spechtbacterales bacterium]